MDDESSSIMIRFTSRSGLSKLLLIVSSDTDCSRLCSRLRLPVPLLLFSLFASRITSIMGGVDPKKMFGSCLFDVCNMVTSVGFSKFKLLLLAPPPLAMLLLLLMLLWLLLLIMMPLPLLLGMVIACDRATTVVFGFDSDTDVTRNRDMELVGELLVDEGGVKGEDSEALLSWTRDT